MAEGARFALAQCGEQAGPERRGRGLAGAARNEAAPDGAGAEPGGARRGRGHGRARRYRDGTGREGKGGSAAGPVPAGSEPPKCRYRLTARGPGNGGGGTHREWRCRESKERPNRERWEPGAVGAGGRTGGDFQAVPGGFGTLRSPVTARSWSRYRGEPEAELGGDLEPVPGGVWSQYWGDFELSDRRYRGGVWTSETAGTEGI